MTLFWVLSLFFQPSVQPKAIILFLTAYATYEQEQTKPLAGYLSKLKFTEADGILLPDDTLPEGFLLNYKRCSHRTMYVPRDGFTLIVSEESIWSSDDTGEQNRESVRTHYVRVFVTWGGLLYQKTGVFDAPFSLKMSTAGALAKPFRVWSRINMTGDHWWSTLRVKAFKAIVLNTMK